MGSLISNFAANLRKARIEAGLTQEELAYRAELHRTYVGGIERGERNVSLQNVEKLAQALRIDPSTLFLRVELDDK